MAEDKSSDFFINLDWDEPTEQLLISWIDIATCYTYLFETSYRKFTSLNYKYSIPIIVLSTITGTISMALDSLVPSDYIKIGQVTIGAINIMTGIVTTLQNFFKFAQQSESHLTASNDWSKLLRNLKIELSIERHNRRPATEFVKSARQEYERLLNSRPIIPIDVLNDFRNKFKDSDIIKPDILERVEHTIVYEDRNIINQYRSIISRNKKPSLLTRLKTIGSTYSLQGLKPPIDGTKRSLTSYTNRYLRRSPESKEESPKFIKNILNSSPIESIDEKTDITLNIEKEDIEIDNNIKIISNDKDSIVIGNINNKSKKSEVNLTEPEVVEYNLEDIKFHEDN